MTIDDIIALGYRADVSFTGDGFTVYRVTGHGVTMQVRDDDQTALGSITDARAHAERAAQASEAPGQTVRRWVREGRVLPPNVRDVT